MVSFSKRWGWAVLPPMLLLLGANTQTIAWAAQPTDRIRGPIDEAVTVQLSGNLRPEVAAATSVGPVEQELPMEHMILTLKGDSAQESALAKLLQDQQNPHSSSYHQFLTPQQFGQQFGASQNDIAKVTAWLNQHGFAVENVPAGRRSIVFSGTAATVASSFGTTIHKLTVGGEVHYANTEEPRIPAALADVVGGFVKLNDFHHKTSIRQLRPAGRDAASPQFTYGSSHYLAPADYATIYDLASLYSNGIDGTGQSIAIVARSNISTSDLETFRSEFGLPANDPTVIIASGTDPGFVSGDGDEATLDVQWSGAVAPKANIKLVVASSTATADGVDLSAQYIVNNNVAPVMSVSFGSCEPGMGSGGVAFYNSLWQQAAAQGITVLVSSGDSGAAGCSAGGSTSGSMRAVNGLCTSPYDVCVGGTEFVEGSNPGQYWLPGNNSTMGSAVSYIPEAVWNESGSNGGSDLWAGGGGASVYFSKPTWQAGVGVPNDNARDVPDVALAAAGHDGYLIEENGGLYIISGTSAASPSFAGIMALVNQKTGTRLGVPNATLYGLASLQSAGGSPVFHDVTSGSNTVPGVAGFAATAGYDRATGLGSVDGALLVNHWMDAVKSPTLAATISPSALTVAAGASGTFTATVAGGGSFKSAVALTLAGAPSGVTVTLSSTSIGSPGSGSVTATVAAAKTTAAGTYTITVTASGGSLVAKATTTLTITNPSFAVATSTTAVNLSTGSSTNLPVSITPSGGFSSKIALSVSGLPSGVTGAFSPASVSGTATSTTALTLTASQSAKSGTFPITLAATGGGITKTVTVNLTVVAPSFSVTLGGPVPTLAIGGTAAIALSVAPSGGFHSPVALTVSGLPAEMTASFSPATLTPTTIATTTLAIRAATTAKTGTFTVLVSATGAGLTQTLPLTITVPTPMFSVSAVSASTGSISPGGTASASITFTPGAGFAAPVRFAVSDLPSGVSASFAPATLSGASAATTTLTFHAAARIQAGTSMVTVTATAAGITKTVSVGLMVQGPTPTFAAGLSNQFITVKAGGPAVTVSMALTQTGTGFNVPVNLAVTGTQANISQKLGNPALTVAAPSTPLTVSAAANASPGIYTIWFAAYTNSQYQPIGLSVTVTR